MMVEIPDVWIILGWVLVVGMVSAVIVRQRSTGNEKVFARLEYYEKQLVEMKIRLDSMYVGVEQPEEEVGGRAQGGGRRSDDYLGEQGVVGRAQGGGRRSDDYLGEQGVVGRAQGGGRRSDGVGSVGPGQDVMGVVLKLISDGVVTSREIQVTINRTREHTARLLKKLFEDGYVKRNTNTKPYTYSITSKGRSEIGIPDA